MQEVASARPEYLLISMALTEQRDGVAEIARAVTMLAHTDQPRVVVGGYPVKAGLIEAIPAAELLPDISMLQL
jgi:hypothetical protein